MSTKQEQPTKEGYDRFCKSYKGPLESDRAYLLACTGNRNYMLRRDLYPGISVNNLPSEKDLQR